MPGISETRTWDAYLTTTLANYRGTLIDNVFDSYPLLSWLNGKLGMNLRGKSIKDVRDSGERIEEELMYGKNTTVKSYAGAEMLDTTIQDGITKAFINWKQYGGSISITGLQRRGNRGKAAIIRLLDSKIKQTEMSLKDALSQGAFSDGTGNSSKDLTGLSAWVDNSSTVGGINPSTHTWWKSYVNSSVGSFAANGKSALRTAFNTVSFGNDKPDFIISDQNVYEYYEASIEPQLRIGDTKAGDAGFDSLKFKGVPWLFDRDCSSGYVYLLNSNYIRFVVMKDADFDMLPPGFQTSIGQDVSTAELIFQGNIVINNRRMHAVLSGITA